MKPIDFLNKLGARPPAIKWAAGYNTLSEARNKCHLYDWLLWLEEYKASKEAWDKFYRGDWSSAALAACDFAENSLVHVPKGEDQPRKAIEAARRWVARKATKLADAAAMKP